MNAPFASPCNVKVLPRILLVDDDAVLREEFKDFFEEHGVAEAFSGEQALQILSRPHQIDVVVLDVRMSGMNGIEVLEKIKKIAPDIRVIILTGYGSKDTAVEALRGRADDYLEKPLHPETVKRILERHLEAKQRAAYGNRIEDKVARIKDFLSRNVCKNVTLSDAAEIVSVSPKYLSRAFQEYAKIGFSDYKVSLRMKEAKQLLKKNTHTVGQISDALGYQNMESFIRQFKKLEKVTPASFRTRINRAPKSAKKYQHN